jgi:hypothetical protein
VSGEKEKEMLLTEFRGQLFGSVGTKIFSPKDWKS